MNYVSVVMACFSILGAADRIIGNRFGLGKEFEKGIMLLGKMGLSMIGMIVIAPLIADVIAPLTDVITKYLPIDPSVIPGLILANDMGGAPLASELALTPQMGYFNGLVIGSMMGATISFSIPFALEVVKKEQHKDMLTGILCGIITIPAGCFVSGLMLKIQIIQLIITLIPLIIFSLVISWGLLTFPNICVKLFTILGQLIKIIITAGLAIGIFRFLTGVEIIKGTAPIEEGSAVIFNASAVMTGAFPLVYILSKILSRPLKAVGKRLHINETSAMGIISTLATNATTFDMMNNMDQKGVVINSAFAVSAAFTFAGHLAFTLAFNPDYIFSVITGKLISGILAIFVSLFVYKKLYTKRRD